MPLDQEDLAADTHTAALDRLVEAHRLLCVRQQHEAADILLDHMDSIVARARTGLEEQQVITRVQEAP